MTYADDFTSGTVISRDGTAIGFRSIGQGPALVLVQGAMGNWYNYQELARLLADSFTLYLPERRGRGISAKPYDPAHRIERDVEDVEAMLDHIGGNYLFGLSSGAMITLQAALTTPRITKAAVFEPPFYADGMSIEGVRQFGAEIGRGDLASALVTAGRIVKLGPAAIRYAPKVLTRLITGKLIRDEAKKGTAPYLSLTELLPAMRYDFQIVSGMNERGRMDRLAAIAKPMLLLSGDKSPAYLRQAIRSLERILPDARHIELPGLDHSGPWNAERGGAPRAVAEALRTFFG